MRVRTAILASLTGLMLNAGLGTFAFAQPVYRHRDPSIDRRHGGARWRAEEAVRQAYLDILRREPDQSELRQYTDAMLRRGWSGGDVRRSLVSSQEYRQQARRPYRRRYR